MIMRDKANVKLGNKHSPLTVDPGHDNIERLINQMTSDNEELTLQKIKVEIYNF